MKYRALGKTGLKVSEIGFGCGNIGGLMIRAPLEERLAAVSRAVELGINYFDTAAAYGNGESEKNLGEVLSSVKLSVIVATKFGVSREDLRDIKGAVRRSLEASLGRLKRDSVDIFQLHTQVTARNDGTSRGVSLEYILGPGGISEALDGLRSEGLIRFKGFTGLGETRALHQLVESRHFDLCQVYFNILNPSAAITVPSDFGSQDFDGLLRKASEKDMGVAAIRILAGGALGGDVSRTGYAAPAVGRALVTGSEYEADRERAGKLEFLLKGNIHRLSQAGIRFVLGQPAVSTALVGFSSIQQLEEAAACSDQGPLLEDDLKQLQKLWSAGFGI